MEALNNFFTFGSVFKVGAIVFSFLFVVLTIQMFANMKQIVKTVVTSRNGFFVFVTLLLVFISVMLFLLGFVIL